MKKRWLSVLAAGVLGACALTGCRKAPEASADSDVLHAKSSVESAVENIAEKDGAKTDGGMEAGSSYDALVGTEENGIWICAEIPAAPQTVPALILRERGDLDADTLKELLDSENGNVQDITAERLLQREKELSEMDEEYKPSEWERFGDDSLLVFSDGTKEASFAGNTTVSYEDDRLKEKCAAIYKTAPEIDVTQDGGADSAKFSAARAEEILLDKLAVLGTGEIFIFKALYYELDGNAFYELRFTPSYEEIRVASEFGQIQKGEVFPQGTAWITEDGVATLSLEEFCGKITEQTEDGKILTFSQVTDILEQYLENNTLCGVPQAKLTQAELVYYPVFQKPELVLKPAWHICTPLEQRMESDDEVWFTVFEKGAAASIYLDAVTGELIKVE